jgi:hypothetical protein
LYARSSWHLFLDEFLYSPSFTVTRRGQSMMQTRTMTLGFKAMFAALLLVISQQGLTETASWVARVTRVLVDASKFGGCMALLNPPPETYLSGCGSAWVTFSCTGDFNDPVLAYRMLDQAQLALVTGKKVFVDVDNEFAHNGYCFASRIDLLSIQ